MSEVMRALGLMSGTSMDGIDVAVIETDGERVRARGPSMTFPYGASMRQQLAEAVSHARAITERRQRPGVLPDVERKLTEHHASAVSAFLRKQGIARMSIDVIGFHGQTVLHRSEDRLSVQLGDGQLLAELARLPVVYDMRARDMELGGQGAPLAPVYHRAMVAELDVRPLAVLNIGGVANVTWIGADGSLVAFDTGPGNGLIDDWVAAMCDGQRCDEDGALAARGHADEAVVQQFCEHSFFTLAPPKSLDRNAFGLGLVEGMAVEDGAATLTAITATAVARAQAHMPEAPRLWVVSGGGRKNPTLMRMLQARVEGDVVTAEAVGLNGDSIEAEAWAFMAVRSLRGLPLTFPGTTGVPWPAPGGVHVKPAKAGP